MKQPQRGFEIIERGIAGHNDREPVARRVLQRRQNECACLVREARGIEPLVEKALELWSARQLGS